MKTTFAGLRLAYLFPILLAFGLTSGCSDVDYDRIDQEFEELCKQHARIEVLYQTDESIDQ